MRKIQQQVQQFMSRYSMSSQQTDIEENARKFIAEMRRGLNGEDCSLRMIPTYYNPADKIKANERVTVLDAGGTNLRAASVWFDENNGTHIEDRVSTEMPGIRTEITDKDLFHEIALLIQTHLAKSETIAFCFSYASIPTPERDGIVNEMGKQLKVKNIVGKKLACGLNDALHEMGCEQKKIVVLNDSVSTLLGSVPLAPQKHYSGYLGFILGTGLNASYVENIKNIGKLRGSCSQNQMIIDTEAGNYDKFPRGVFDEEYDKTLMDFGLWQFEKMAAGRYQGGLIYFTVKKAIEDGLFSDRFGKKFSRAGNLVSRQIDEFLDQPDGDGVLAGCCAGEDPNDAVTLYYIINEMIERAAKMTTACLAAMMLQAQIGENPFRPACITGDGSTFYKSKMFQRKLEYYMKQCVNDQLGLHYRFRHVTDVNMIGSAIAALSN